MFSKSILLFFMLISIFGISQVKNPDGLDFLEFTTGDYHYEVLIITDEFVSDLETTSTQATVRVHYGDKTVEYYSVAEFEVVDDSILITVKPKSKTVKVIEGTASYNPDTFLLIMDMGGNFVKGEATDENSTTGNKLTFSEAKTFTERLANLKKFYNSDDPLYTKLVKLLKEEFVSQ